jgi:hypothetical protein
MYIYLHDNLRSLFFCFFKFSSQNSFRNLNDIQLLQIFFQPGQVVLGLQIRQVDHILPILMAYKLVPKRNI